MGNRHSSASSKGEQGSVSSLSSTSSRSSRLSFTLIGSCKPRSNKPDKVSKAKKKTNKSSTNDSVVDNTTLVENPDFCTIEPSGAPGEAKRIAEQWVQAKNDGDFMKLLKLASYDANFRFPAANVVIPMRDFLDMMISVRDAFPDLHFKYDTLEESQDGVAVLTDYFAIGTHTGTPYQFPPGEPIPPTGVKVINGPMIQTIKIRDGHVIDLECASPPDVLAGPSGFYVDTKKAHEEKIAQGDS